MAKRKKFLQVGNRLIGGYYFDYLPKTKTGFGKRKASRNFKTLSEVKKEAKKRQKKGKIVQATFYKSENILSDKMVGGLNTKGKFHI